MRKMVSVIIPCYNLDADIFSVCMNSVLNQSIGLDNIEIILVNDASQDNGATDRLLSQYECRYPDNIKVICLEYNMRQGGARNIGLEYADGEYVTFLDSDDWVEDTLYARAYDMAVENNLDLVYFFHQAVKGDLKLPLDDLDTPSGVYQVSSVEQRKSFIMQQIIDLRCTTKLYKRSFLMETGVQFPEHKVYEEPKFTYPLLYYGTRFGVFAEVLYNYRMNENSTMNTSHTFERLRNHPEVQLMLFEEMAERKLLDEYYDEITYHFMHSYFVETLLFAANQNIVLPIEYFREMQNTVLTLIPAWRENPYIKGQSDDVLPGILEKGLQAGFSQETLSDFVKWVKQLFNS